MGVRSSWEILATKSRRERPSRERPAALEDLKCEAVLSPYRHELALKTRWLPTVEPQLECDAILYPFWPSPPIRHQDAPPAAVFVHDLAFRIRPQEVPWQQRVYMRAVLGRALRSAAAVLVPSESTRRDLLAHYKDPTLESKVVVVREGLPPQVPAGQLGQDASRSPGPAGVIAIEGGAAAASSTAALVTTTASSSQSSIPIAKAIRRIFQ